MRIRRATITDVPRLVDLNGPVQNRHAMACPTRFRGDVPVETVAAAFVEMVEASASFWLVAEESQPIAFLTAEFRQRDESWCSRSHQICYLAGIVVEPGFRQRGVARALLAELKRETQSREIDAIELDVWAFNAEAKEAFASLGFGTVMERMSLWVGAPGRP